MNINGIKIIPHPLARDIRTVWRVERHPIPKKRRQWHVVKHVIDKPGCWIVGGVAYMHPELVARLKGGAS